jgi:hypothetical protein
MVAFTRYGDQMRRQRKLMQGALGATNIPKYHPLLEIETGHLLRRLLEGPEDYVSHIRRYAGGLTLLVVYGYQAVTNDDPFLLLANHCVDLLSNEIASGGGIWPVDIFPFCQYSVTLVDSSFTKSCIAVKHLPEWLPGTSFLRKAKVWRAKMLEFVDKPFNYVKESMVCFAYVQSYRCCIQQTHSEMEQPSRPSARLCLKTEAPQLAISPILISVGPQIRCILVCNPTCLQSRCDSISYS